MLYTSVGDNMKSKKLYKKNNRGIIISLLIFSFVLMLSVGYSVLNEELTISGEAHFRAQSDIRITDVNLYITSNNGVEDYNSTYGKDSMKVGVTLPSNNSSVTYKVTVTNYSNIPMKINKIAKEIENNNYVVTFNKTLPLTIGKLSSEEIEITFKNNTSSSQTINANLLFTFVKQEAMMTIGNTNAATTTFYRGPLTKDSIESITFMSTKEVPEEAVGYWDCSYVQGKNEVIAYYLNSETEGMYDLYIAADGEVYAPANSSALFYYFTNAKSINFNNSFNTDKLTNSSFMFRGCSKLTSLDVSKFNTSNATDMGAMFADCKLLEDINGLSLLDTHNAVTFIKNGQGMFQNDSKLTTIDLSGWNTKKVTNMNFMFYKCTSLNNIIFGDNFDTSKVTQMVGMFNGCTSLEELNISQFNTESLVNTHTNNNNGLFQGCTALKSLDLSGWDTHKVTSMAHMFEGCQSLTKIIFGDGFNTEKVTNMGGMFRGCKSLINIDTEKFDTTLVKSFYDAGCGMFQGCSSLITLNLSNWNTENANTMQGMFYECTNLSSIIFGDDFNTSNVTTMREMFYGCSSLTNLDIRGFNTEKVTTMQSMFKNCSKLTKLDLSRFNTQMLTNMYQMFQNCTKLENIDMSNFTTDSLTTLFAAFSGCSSLKSIDIRKMDFENKTITVNNLFLFSSYTMDIYVLNEYNKTYIEGLNSRANVIIPEA